MAKTKVKIIPLGGLGEIGKNMMLLEYQEDIIIIDAGVMFPDEEMLGIDLVIPDCSYLADKKERIRGIFITHGHEDHIGALPYIFPQIEAPIYATKLTTGLISVKLKERKLLERAQLNVIQSGDEVTLGHFRVEFFHVNHSIPDCVGVAVHTPCGTIVHTGDYKFDHTPIDGKAADFGKLAQLGSQGVLLLLGDSTRVEVPGYTASEQVVNETLDKMFAEAPGRIILATFASLISRVQQVIDVAVRYERKVALTGRSMINNMHMAMDLGYLSMPPDILIKIEDAHKYARDQVVIVTTGSQGEPTSALTRIANKDHRQIRIEPGDTVILSATPIPGNDKSIHRTINLLFQQGAEVFYEAIANVHVSGHASQEEMKLMIALLRPQFFIPIHGEYRHLVLHTKLAQSIGMSASNTLVIEDGDVVEVTSNSCRKTGHVPCGYVFVDGIGVGDVGEVVLRDRQMLAQDGILMAVVTIDKETGEAVAGPDIVSRGFVYMRESEALIDQAREQVLASLQGHNGSVNGNGSTTADWSYIKTKIKDTLSAFLYEKTKRRPMILPVVMEV